MLLKINGEMKEFESPLTVAELLNELKYDATKIAVAVDTTFVSRASYAETVINQSCEIDIVAPMQGG